jgi:hypothetical protein
MRRGPKGHGAAGHDDISRIRCPSSQAAPHLVGSDFAGRLGRVYRSPGPAR